MWCIFKSKREKEQYKVSNDIKIGDCLYGIKDNEAYNNGFTEYGEKTYDYIILDTNKNGVMIQPYYFNKFNELKSLTPSFHDWGMMSHSFKYGSKIKQDCPDYLEEIVKNLKEKQNEI